MATIRLDQRLRAGELRIRETWETFKRIKAMNASDDRDMGFNFSFGDIDRADLLAEASRTVGALGFELGGAARSGVPAKEAAHRLLSQLDQEVAELGAYPEVLELKEAHFVDHGLTVPKRFKDLNKDSRFYWLRLPVTLSPMENHPFSKLECAIEFNPGSDEGHLRPKAHMILPDRKFRQLLQINDSLELNIGENFEFEAGMAELNEESAAGKLKAKAAVDAKAAAKLGLVAGPFTYRMRKALLEHSPAGTEKVFWRLADAQFFQEDDPTLIVVMQAPRTIERVEIAAALQAYHQFDVWGAELSSVLRYFRERLANFFRQGAPTRHTRVWDITPSLCKIDRQTP